MVVLLDSPQPVFVLPPLSEITDTAEDKPLAGDLPDELGPMGLPELMFGAASFSNQYNADDHLSSVVPLRTVRLALRYGIKAFDTSAYYGPSEIVLGTALKTLEAEFPRESYKLLTKCGRYGATSKDFDYSPATIRRSVQRSLNRLNTSYLDAVYLHDVEFVCATVQPRSAGNHVTALSTEGSEYGLAPGQETTIWGHGDKVVLDAYAELRKLKEEGLIRHIGISGYPLPVLLRISLLILHTAPYEPVDVLMSYSHLNLQNSSFADFVPHFRNRARVQQLVTASPVNMGLLSPSPPAWHPAPKEIKDAVRAANEEMKGEIVNLALGYSYRAARGLQLPTVVGLSRPSEVHETIHIWRDLKVDGGAERMTNEEKVWGHLAAYKDHSWASP
ncbi:Aldo/keto reductase [Trametopsis cervina]|nr:Aldo/keto reductase [Trametopsis cervina]